MKKLFILLALFFFVRGSYSQQYIFNGRVIDKVTHAPVADANITFTSTNSGVTSNRKGEFTFFLDKFPSFMIVSHIGYATKRIWLDGKSNSLVVMMEPSEILLKEVEIKSSNTPETFFKDRQFSVLDYEVADNLIYLLIYRFRLARSEILCKSESGDTISRSGLLSFSPRSLFLDCLGKLHVLSSDSAYEIMRDNDSLLLFSPVDIERFRAVLMNCVASSENYLYFRRVSPDRQIVVFDQANRITHMIRRLTSASNEQKLKMLRKNPGDYSFLVSSRIPDDREEFEEYSWIRQVLYRPNTTVLCTIGDILGVFNTVDNSVEFYNQDGEFYAKLQLAVKKVTEGKWTTEIYVDEVLQQTYTSFIRNGLITIYRINLNNGDLRQVLSTSHAYPLKIRIHNRYLFYLYDGPGQWDYKQLFRQRI